MTRLAALEAVAMVTPDADRLARFYAAALDARPAPRPGASESRAMSIGAQRLELLQFEAGGLPYPEGAGGNDPRFQHFAVVVSDMAQAWARLAATSGWTTISTGAPVRLPKASGGVTAFKFRDPDGHPVELIAFPADSAPPTWRDRRGLFLGIDHSAITVADVERSVAFYEAQGLAVTGRSDNVGPEQARLDGLVGAHVQVVALAPQAATPHVELLGYVSPTPGQSAPVGPRDVAATRLVFRGSEPATLTDPDGHRLIVLA